MLIDTRDQIEILKYYRKFFAIQESFYFSVEIQKWKSTMKIFPLKSGLQMQLGRDVVTYEIYQMVHSLMLLWQHAWFQSLPLQHQILPFVVARTLLREDQVFCLVESKMVIFDPCQVSIAFLHYWWRYS